MSRVRSYSCRQRGVSIVLVLFLLTVVVVMVVSMANLSTGQHLGSLYSARGAQAYFAARAGVDYAISRISDPGNLNPDRCDGVNSSLPNIGGTGYDVTIDCVLAGSFDEGNPVPFSVYSISAVASGGGFQVPDVATREVRATIKNP